MNKCNDQEDFQKLGFNVSFLSKFLYQFSRALNGIYELEALSAISEDWMAKLDTYSKKFSNIFLPNSADTDGLFSDLLCKSRDCCSTSSTGSIEIPILAIYLLGISSVNDRQFIFALFPLSTFLACDTRNMADGFKFEMDPNSCHSSLMPASDQLKYTAEKKQRNYTLFSSKSKSSYQFRALKI